MSGLGALVLAAVFTRSLQPVVSMDPIRSQAVYDSYAVSLVCASPLAIDYSARPYRLIPSLCSLPEVSSDGLVYTLRSDGRASAAEIAASLERLRDPVNVSPGAWTMKNVRSIEVADDLTLRITLHRRQHVFPWMLAMSYAGVRRADGSGTGAFELVKWHKNHEMRFERRQPAKGGFDTVRYFVVNDVSTEWLMFLKGELDFLGNVPRDNWDAVVDGDGNILPDLARRGIRLYVASSLQTNYLGFNMRDKILGGNRQLRQALNCAFDFPTWRKFQKNSVDPSSGPVPPGVAGRLETPFEFAFDLDKARRLLAEAGYPEGRDARTGRRLELALDIGRPTKDSREQGELIASFYERIGIRLVLRMHTWEAFLRAVNEGRAQIYLMGWVGDYPDAENFLQLFHSRNVSPGANHSDYVNPAFDEEYDAAMQCSSAEERNRHWLRCQEIVREDCPWVFCHHPRNYSLVGPRVGNFVPGDFPYGQEAHFTYEENTCH